MARGLGIIAEYNPFHNGHAYHIQKAKKEAKADYVVAVMTGNFTQRGETSIINKWEKTKMAINSGVDLVIELPTLYSISSAENFASGAVKILNSIGIIDTISFGMEAENLADLNNIANLLIKEPEEYRKILKQELDKGISYPRARQNAVGEYLNDPSKYTTILNGSNNILAIEYLKALKKQNSKLIPLGIKRNKVYYNSSKVVDEYASSTAIRNLIANKNIEEVSKVVPSSTFSILLENIKNGTYNVNLSVFSKEIIYKLRSMTIKEIANLPEVSEGLENLIKATVEKTNDLDILISNIISKRYTQTKIQRILLYALLNINKKDMEMSKKIIPYIRILGCTKTGKKLLSEINWRTPAITSLKKFEDINSNKKISRMLEIDKYATDIYTLGYKSNSMCNLDYTEGIIIE